MGFRQLLDVVRSTHQRVVIKLLIPDLHHLKDDLSVFLSQLLCRAFRVRGKATDDTRFTSKPAVAR